MKEPSDPPERYEYRRDGHQANVTNEPPPDDYEHDDGDAPDAEPFASDGQEANADKAEQPRTPRPAAWPVLDVAAIFGRLEPVNYLLAPLDLCPGAPALFAGYGFSGKTVAAQELALRIATGGRAHGNLKTRQRGSQGA